MDQMIAIGSNTDSPKFLVGRGLWRTTWNFLDEAKRPDINKYHYKGIITTKISNEMSPDTSYVIFYGLGSSIHQIHGCMKDGRVIYSTELKLEKVKLKRKSIWL